MEEPKYKWLLGPMLTISMVVCGLATSWGVTKTSLDIVENKTKELEVTIKEHENKIREIQIKQAGSTEILKNIQKSLEEIKEDLRALRSNRKRN